MLQSKAAWMIISSFRATSIFALSIKVYFIAMQHIPDKLVIESELQIAETSFYNLLQSTRSKRKNRRITPLKTLTSQYKAC